MALLRTRVLKSSKEDIRHDKRGDSVARWMNDGKMLWVDKKKALDYFSVSAPIAEAQNNQELISTANIIQNFQNPKRCI